MLTQAQNDRITRVAPGTPMGNLMRRYWHPVAASVEVNEENPTKEVRLLGEDLVLFRSTRGVVGLIEPSCPHRKANLSYGVPEPEGIRCAYHGWLFDETGACIDQPSEPAGSKFKDKVKLKAYKTEELGGLIFAYMGPEPAPLLPNWDILTWTNVTRTINAVDMPANWLQCMDNSLDPVHFQWLHRYWGGWNIARKLPAGEGQDFDRSTLSRGREHVKVGFDRFEYGIVKRRLLEGEAEEDQWWRIGHPILFPNILRVAQDHWHSFQYRIPIDDTHTKHMLYTVVVPEPGVMVAEQGFVPYVERELYDEKGRLNNTIVPAQDEAAWVMQGPITDRTTEHLGVTDVGIILFRKMINENLQIVEDGGEPINVHRDPAKNVAIPLATEHTYYPGDDFTGGQFADKPLLPPQVEASMQ
ncbi:MAG: Rieske 2Fe-2S domain-containing protein [Chloroflexi bacterium]|nr:Rieske 2Fe-2S domain-containing protein [Chloroflexota bacterium]